MDQFMRRPVHRRGLLRGAAIGAGAVSLGMGGIGYYGQIARAQDATAEAGNTFNAEACFRAFPGATTVQYEKLADPPYKIAVSNSYIGNVWRTQMIKMAYAYSKSPDVADLIDQDFFTAVTNDRDDAAQQAAIENMISNGAQAVVILANTPTALVQTVQQARADGIVIVSFDTTVHPEPPDPSIDTGVTVNEDQVEMGRLLAEFLIKETGGEGKILMVNGVQGTGVDTERRQGAQEVWDANPGISIVEVVGDWDPGKAQTATATALAANPDFAGVWCQGGTDGVVRAFQDAGIPIPPIAGEAENGFRKQMLEYKDEFNGLSIGQTPGLVAVSMRAALSLLLGDPVPSAVSVPLPMATTDQLVPGVNVFPDAPDNFFTATTIPECGVNLTFEEVDAQQV